MIELYDGLGEFHDLFMFDVWDRLEAHLSPAFGTLTSEDLVLDVGAGSGLGTRALSRRTRAQILAIEPSRTMRTALLARVADDEDLARRVSVLAGGAPDAIGDVPGPIAGFVCAHMLGHLAADARTATFQGLARLLAPGGTGVLTLSPDPAPGDDDHEVVEEERTLGRHRYVSRFEPSPDGRSANLSYLVFDRDRLMRSSTFPVRWDPPSGAELRDELAHAGLAMVPAASGVALARHREEAR